MNWWNLLTFCVIPLLSVVAVFCVKRKFLWLAPLVSTGLTILISIGAMPTILSDTEHRSMFFWHQSSPTPGSCDCLDWGCPCNCLCLKQEKNTEIVESSGAAAALPDFIHYWIHSHF